jgi:hypothetical protein
MSDITPCPSLRALHSHLAQAVLASRRPGGTMAAPGTDATAQTRYFSQASLGAFGYLECQVILYDPDERATRLCTFLGKGGGSVVGGGIAAGSSWLSRPIAELEGRTISFEASLLPFVININWWDDSGAIGSFVGGGLSIGTGFSGGSGSFAAVRLDTERPDQPVSTQ